jgi:hypothetical protein
MPATMTVAVLSIATLGFVEQIEQILCVVAPKVASGYAQYTSWVTNNRTILKAYLHVRFQAAILH